MGARVFLALWALLASGHVAAAQTSLSTPPKGAAGPPTASPRGKAECALLPGGKAPVGPIADLPTPLSPRSLDLVYFGKRLADLTAADFQRIAELSKRCGPGQGILGPDKIEKLRAVIAEAQRARQATLAWGKGRMAEVDAMPVGRPKLVRLNDLWVELESHEGEMVRADVDDFAAWIAREQQVIYDAAPRWRPNRPAIAVMPVPPLPQSRQNATSLAGDTPILFMGRPRLPGGEVD